MTYKRRRLESGTPFLDPSSRTLSSGPQSISRMSSAHESASSSSPRLPTLPGQRRITPRAPSSCGFSAPRTRDEDVTQSYEIETDAEIRDREGSDNMNEIIMAVDMKERGTIGCAYYIAREEKLCLMEDIKMGGLEIIDTLKLQAQPTVVLISTRSDERLEEHLRPEAGGIDRGDEASEFILWLVPEVADSVQTIFLVHMFLMPDPHLILAM